MNEGSTNQQHGHCRQGQNQRPGCAQQPAYGALFLLIMPACTLAGGVGPLVNRAGFLANMTGPPVKGAGRSGRQQASGKPDKASRTMMAGQIDMAKDKQELDQHGQQGQPSSHPSLPEKAHRHSPAKNSLSTVLPPYCRTLSSHP